MLLKLILIKRFEQAAKIIFFSVVDKCISIQTTFKILYNCDNVYLTILK